MRKFLVIALSLAAIAGNSYANGDNMRDTGNTDATSYSATGVKADYSNKNLANYQDPYLTNPRAYKSNQYGEAAPAPQPNVFYSVEEPAYNPPPRAIDDNDRVIRPVTYIDR